MKLSIIIPVFNEEKTIQAVLKRIDQLHIPNVEKEVIIVDDASQDTTGKIIKDFLIQKRKHVVFLQHVTNQGKGAAVRTGIASATGEYIVIQDADLEYNPEDISRLVKEIKNGLQVVFGTRLNRLPHLSKEEKRFYFLLHYVGNRFLSFATSILYGQWITDMETCYKLFPRKNVTQMKLRAKGFEFEPEITAKLMKKGLKIKEIPINTIPRGYEEGKKLHTIRDGTKAVWTLIKYRVSD